MSVKPTEIFSKFIGSSPFIETERAKRHLIYLFEQALESGQDMKLMFPADRDKLGREVTGGFNAMVQCLGAEGLMEEMDRAGVSAFFACDDDPEEWQNREITILPGGINVENGEASYRFDHAKVIDLDHPDVQQAISSIHL